MSHKYRVEQQSSGHYVLPKIGDMKCHVDAFLSESLWEKTDEGLWGQAVDSACYDGVTGVYLMPDCLADETEVLTSEGFVMLRDLTKNHKIANVDLSKKDTPNVFFSHPHHVFTRDLRPNEKVYKHTFEAFKKEIITTEGHRHAYLPSLGTTTEELPSVSFTKDYQWAGQGCVEVGSIDFSDDTLRFLVWIIGDGSIKTTRNKHSDNRRIRFGLKKQRKISRVVELMDRLGLGYTVSTSPKQTEIYVNTKSSELFLELVGPSKKFPFQLVTCLDVRQACLILEEAIQVDGDFENHSKAGVWILNSNRQEDLDFFCALVAVNLGVANARNYPQTTNFGESNKGRVSVVQSEKTRFAKNGLHNRKVVKKQIPYEGRVSCLSCDTGFFIARSNGLTFITGNCHLGYGIPVGGVVVTDGTIIQSGSGYDISCGCLYLKTPLKAEDIQSWDVRKSWVEEVEKRIATGVGNNRPHLAKKIRGGQVDEVLRYGAKAIGVSADVCERQYIPIPDGIDLTKIERAYSKCVHQLGSVGGGNHFIEMQVDGKDGSVWVMIHCGSRGYGWQTANHFFHKGAELRGLSSKRRERSHLYADETLGKEYWAYHNSAANFAVANRHIIVEGVQEALRKVFGREGKVYYEISHNLVQEETLVLPDGNTKRGFVHRKGATRAFPAGHPDLVGTVWAETGHPCLIPGSMLSGAAILFPKQGAYKSGCSVNHGSGRVMGRAHAKREFADDQELIDEEMRTITRTFDGVEVVGIVGNTKKTPLDECGMVYKDLDEVLAVLEDEGIAEVAHRLYPVANIKGTD